MSMYASGCINKHMYIYVNSHLCQNIKGFYALLFLAHVCPVQVQGRRIWEQGFNRYLENGSVRLCDLCGACCVRDREVNILGMHQIQLPV